MNKKIKNHEIDLSVIFFKILNNKLKIVLITLLITVVSSLTIYSSENRSNTNAILLAETEVVSNSIFGDYEYEALNDFINNFKTQNLSLFDVTLRPENQFGNEIKKEDELVPDNFKNYNMFSNFNLGFGPIDRSFLYQIFIEKLNQKDFFVKAIIKSDLIDKKKFNNNNDYEKAVIELVSAIKIIHEKENGKIHSVKIKFKTSNKYKWENFLYFIEETANNEIQDYLNKKFEILILNMNRTTRYLLEDIEFELLGNKDNALMVLKLNNIKRRTIANKNVERLINLYKDTPIYKSNEFYAAKIKFESTKYKDITNYPTSITKIIFVSILLGVLLAIIYVVIASTTKNRR